VAPICVVIGRTRHQMVRAEIQEAARQGAGFIELRLDLLAKAPDFHRLLEVRPCPLLATIRRPSDGGRWSGTEDARLTLLRQAIVAGFDWIDLETDIIDRIPRFRDVKRIVSYHNMQEFPDDFEEIHAAMCRQDADIVKLAVRAQSCLDNLRALDLVRKASKPTVAICMGDLGTPSRVLGRKYGSPFTYAAFNKERNLAPGLLTFDDLRRVYNYERINAETRVFGVIGDPIAHSLSPLLHNSAFRQQGVNAVYVPFRVPKGELAEFLQAYEQIPVEGYSVTIPHKEQAAALAKQLDDPVRATQAANTLLRGATGFTAYNTDFQAALDSLQAHLATTAPLSAGGPPTLASRNVLILGAGGVARAIAHALHRQQAMVSITNRTEERAQKLAEEVGCRHVAWSNRHAVLADVLINCTSVGMYPNVDQSPMHPSYFHQGMVVFDTIYNPENTLFLKEARSRDASVLSGADMFVRQAGLQYELFCGQKPPLELMRRVVRQALSPVTVREDDE
jgi:3-dehydroquinate dehydratase/shikimate dehydrogenase